MTSSLMATSSTQKGSLLIWALWLIIFSTLTITGECQGISGQCTTTTMAGKTEVMYSGVSMNFTILPYTIGCEGSTCAGINLACSLKCRFCSRFTNNLPLKISVIDLNTQQAVKNISCGWSNSTRSQGIFPAYCIRKGSLTNISKMYRLFFSVTQDKHTTLLAKASSTNITFRAGDISFLNCGGSFSYGYDLLSRGQLVIFTMILKDAYNNNITSADEAMTTNFFDISDIALRTSLIEQPLSGFSNQPELSFERIQGKLHFSSFLNSSGNYTLYVGDENNGIKDSPFNYTVKSGLGSCLTSNCQKVQRTISLVCTETDLDSVSLVMKVGVPLHFKIYAQASSCEPLCSTTPKCIYTGNEPKFKVMLFDVGSKVVTGFVCVVGYIEMSRWYPVSCQVRNSLASLGASYWLRIYSTEIPSFLEPLPNEGRTIVVHAGLLSISACEGYWENNVNAFTLNDVAVFTVTLKDGYGNTISNVTTSTINKTEIIEKLAIETYPEGVFDEVPKIQINERRGLAVFTLYFKKGGDFMMYVGGKSQGIKGSPFSFSIATEANSPQAIDDDVFVWENSTTNIDVLSNDVAVFGSLTIEEIEMGPIYGIATIKNGLIQYIPNAGFIGRDNFFYTIKNEKGKKARAQVQVFVVREVPQIYLQQDHLIVTEDETLSLKGAFFVNYSNMTDTLTLKVYAESGDIYHANTIKRRMPANQIQTSNFQSKPYILESDNSIVSWKGKLSAINDTLQDLIYKGAKNFNGEDVIHISIMDSSGKGTQMRIKVTLRSKNSMPYINSPFGLLVDPNTGVMIATVDKYGDVLERENNFISVGDPDQYDERASSETLLLQSFLQVDVGALSINLPKFISETIQLQNSSTNAWDYYVYSSSDMESLDILGSGIKFRASINESNIALSTLSYIGGVNGAKLLIVINDMGSWGCYKSCKDNTSYPLQEEKTILLYTTRPNSRNSKHTMMLSLSLGITFLILYLVLTFFILDQIYKQQINKNRTDMKQIPSVYGYSSAQKDSSTSYYESANKTRKEVSMMKNQSVVSVAVPENQQSNMGTIIMDTPLQGNIVNSKGSVGYRSKIIRDLKNSVSFSPVPTMLSKPTLSQKQNSTMAGLNPYFRAISSKAPINSNGAYMSMDELVLHAEEVTLNSNARIGIASLQTSEEFNDHPINENQYRNGQSKSLPAMQIPIRRWTSNLQRQESNRQSRVSTTMKANSLSEQHSARQSTVVTDPAILQRSSYESRKRSLYMNQRSSIAENLNKTSFTAKGFEDTNEDTDEDTDEIENESHPQEYLFGEQSSSEDSGSEINDDNHPQNYMNSDEFMEENSQRLTNERTSLHSSFRDTSTSGSDDAYPQHYMNEDENLEETYPRLMDEIISLRSSYRDSGTGDTFPQHYMNKDELREDDIQTLAADRASSSSTSQDTNRNSRMSIQMEDSGSVQTYARNSLSTLNPSMIQSGSEYHTKRLSEDGGHTTNSCDSIDAMLDRVDHKQDDDLSIKDEKRFDNELFQDGTPRISVSSDELSTHRPRLAMESTTMQGGMVVGMHYNQLFRHEEDQET